MDASGGGPPHRRPGRDGAEDQAAPIMRDSGYPTKLTEPRLGCSPPGRRQERREASGGTRRRDWSCRPARSCGLIRNRTVGRPPSRTLTAYLHKGLAAVRTGGHSTAAPNFIRSSAVGWRARPKPARIDGRDAMTTGSATCCCGQQYKDRGGASSHHCPAGERKLCEECATAGNGACPTHKVPVSF